MSTQKALMSKNCLVPCFFPTPLIDKIESGKLTIPERAACSEIPGSRQDDVALSGDLISHSANLRKNYRDARVS
jgi:hypothetical protein